MNSFKEHVHKHYDDIEAKSKGKPWYKSKMIWLNVASILSIMGGIVPINADVAMLLTALANIILRLITKEPIKD